MLSPGGQSFGLGLKDLASALASASRNCPRPRPRSLSSGLGLGLEVLASFSITGVNGHTTRCTSSVSVVLQLRLVSGWGLMIRRSAPHHGPLRLAKGLFYWTLLQNDMKIFSDTFTAVGLYCIRDIVQAQLTASFIIKLLYLLRTQFPL